MKIDSTPANVATAGAKVAQANANSATDGAQICTDKEEGSDAKLAGFQAIFQQVSQQIAVEKAAPETQAVDESVAPKLPEATSLPKVAKLPDVPPPAVINQQPAPDVAKPSPAQSTNLKKGNALNVDEPATDEPVEPKDAPQKPDKHPAAKCDSTVPPPAMLMQPVQIGDSTPPQAEEEAQPVIAESNGKRKAVQAEKIALPQPKEVDEVPAAEARQPKAQKEIQPAELPDQVPDQIPVSTRDESAPAQQKHNDTPKLEFTLPQPHITPKEVDQPAPPPVAPEQAFIDANHSKIVTAIHGELLPNGGSMHIRMDPPELGALNVQIDVRDGIVTASFQTSNDEATRLLSHSLGQLRTTLESAGVTVEKLQVQQAPREHFNSNSRDSDRSPNQQAYERSAHDDRQRRKMLQRMWRRLTVGRDMLDLVA